MTDIIRVQPCRKKKLFKPGNWKYTREMVAWGSKGGKKDEREGVPVIPTE